MTMRPADKKFKRNLIIVMVGAYLVMNLVFNLSGGSIFGSLGVGLVALLVQLKLEVNRRKADLLAKAQNQPNVNQLADEVERYGDRFRNSGNAEAAQAALERAQKIRTMGSATDAMAERNLYLSSIGMPDAGLSAQTGKTNRGAPDFDFSDNS